jgi:GntR family negative regulator for fad regulon and positive regulator of fabA
LNHFSNLSAPQRPVDYAEQALVTAILDGTYPAGSTLPGERDLAAQLGVTRPTLREVLRRLERDGWLTVHQGKATTVNNIWRDGGLNVLSTLVRYSDHFPPDFIPNLLQVRLALAPAFVAAAVARDPAQVIAVVGQYADLPDEPDAFAAFDWNLQRCLTMVSGNPIYTLIINGFTEIYAAAARRYFARARARTASRTFYAALLDAARRQDVASAGQVTRAAMQQSIELWQELES